MLESAEIVAVALWPLVTGTAAPESNCKVLERTGNETLAGRVPLVPSNVGPVVVAICGGSGESPKDPGVGAAVGPNEFETVPEPLPLEPLPLEPLLLELLLPEPLLAVCEPGELATVANAGAVPPPPPPLEQAAEKAQHSVAIKMT